MIIIIKGPILLFGHLLTTTLTMEKSDPSDIQFSLIMTAISLFLTAPLYVHILT